MPAFHPSKTSRTDPGSGSVPVWTPSPAGLQRQRLQEVSAPYSLQGNGPDRRRPLEMQRWCALGVVFQAESKCRATKRRVPVRGMAGARELDGVARSAGAN